MAKTLSRFYFLKKDENKEKATLFVRVQDPSRKIDVQFTTRIQVGVAEWKAAVADEDSLARHRQQNPKLHDKLGRIEVMLKREMSAPQFDRHHIKSEILAISDPEKYEIQRAQKESKRRRDWRKSVSVKNRNGSFRRVSRLKRPRYGIIFHGSVPTSSQESV